MRISRMPTRMRILLWTLRSYHPFRHVILQQPLVSLVDIQEADHPYIGDDAVLGTDIDYLLRFRHAADC